ncbi:NmrA family NAD(P)-binding protein [Streptomyces sp. NPDC056244]|uniref:NmrA family NAD(P)-binding protein n=1 Tax=unclassified Streptomyces TaxID=2593676 RepID=UPI0035D666B0
MVNDRRVFLITGAAGKTGRAAAELLLERGHKVRALVRQDDDRAKALAAAGAETVVGDLLDLDDMSRAVHGVSGAYFCYPIRDGLLEATTVFAQAAVDADVRSVVNMSQISARREAKSNAARGHWLGERLLDRTDMLTTHLRPTFFAAWLRDWWEYRDGRDGEGVLRLPFGRGRHAPVAETDQARVIAAVLADPEPHNRKTYTLHGPVEMDHYEIAEAMSRGLGIPVRYEPISVEEFAAAMTARGRSAHLVQHLSNVAVDYQQGIFAGTNDVIQDIGGRAPLTVEEYVAGRKEDFRTSGPNFVPAPPA